MHRDLELPVVMSPPNWRRRLGCTRRAAPPDKPGSADNQNGHGRFSRGAPHGADRLVEKLASAVRRRNRMPDCDSGIASAHRQYPARPQKPDAFGFEGLGISISWLDCRQQHPHSLNGEIDGLTDHEIGTEADRQRRIPALPFRHRALRIRASISADQLGASIASLKDMTATGTASRMSSAWRQLGWGFHPDADQAVVTETAGCSGQ